MIVLIFFMIEAVDMSLGVKMVNVKVMFKAYVVKFANNMVDSGEEVVENQIDA